MKKNLNLKMDTRQQLSTFFDSDNTKLNPWFVTGFSDGESCFIISVQKNLKMKTGWEVRACFSLGLHPRDQRLIEQLQSFFGVGKVFLSKNAVAYKVSSLKEIEEVIIPHFNKYPLITQKQADFELFKVVIGLMKQKNHLTLEGLQEIINNKASMNLGLSDELITNFKVINAVSRPVVKFTEIPDPHWVAGFTEAEGCFLVNTSKSLIYQLGMQSWLKFQITQHSRDAKLMESLKEYLGCGLYYPDKSGKIGDFVVVRLSDHVEKIIPFFDNYPLQGCKLQDFEDFKKVANIMKTKGHRTLEGLDEILKIKGGMNKVRKW
jgi:hypothetical protein